MNLFGFGKPAPATLLRAWCSPFGSQERSGEYLAFVDALLARIPAASFAGSVNEGDPLDLASLRRTLGRMAASKAGSLVVRDEAGRIALAIVLDPASLRCGPRVHEVVAVLPPGRRADLDHVLALLSAGQVHYAYARPVAAAVDPLSETRARRSLFRASRAREDAGREVWLVAQDDVRAGAVRALYPVNVLSSVALARLAGVGLRLPHSMPERGGVVWRPDDDEQAEMLRLNPDFREWLRFDQED